MKKKKTSGLRLLFDKFQQKRLRFLNLQQIC